MNYVKLVSIISLLMSLSATVIGQNFKDCFHQILPTLKNNPTHCFEYKYSEFLNGGITNYQNLVYIRKYTFGEKNLLSGWIENSKFRDLSDSLDGFSQTVLLYDSLEIPISYTRYNGIKEVTYEEIYTYDKKSGKIIGEGSANFEKYFIEFDCEENTITYKNKNGEILNLRKKKSDLSDDYIVFFRQMKNGIPEVKEHKETTLTKIIREDEYGNAIEFTKLFKVNSRQETFYRHYIYPKENLEEKRTINEVIDELIDAFRNGNFDHLVEETFFLGKEVMILNSPYLGKTDLLGLHWVNVPKSKGSAEKHIKDSLIKKRTRKNLNWPKLKLDKITEKEIKQGGYNIGENILNARYKFTVTDGERKMKFYLQFLKLNQKWYIYYNN